MGAKQSAGGSAPLGQSPTLENIRAAYGDGEGCRAHELIRIACQENETGRPHGVRHITEEVWRRNDDLRLQGEKHPPYEDYLQWLGCCCFSAWLVPYCRLMF